MNSDDRHGQYPTCQQQRAYTQLEAAPRIAELLLYDGPEAQTRQHTGLWEDSHKSGRSTSVAEQNTTLEKHRYVRKNDPVEEVPAQTVGPTTYSRPSPSPLS